MRPSVVIFLAASATARVSPWLPRTGPSPSPSPPGSPSPPPPPRLQRLRRLVERAPKSLSPSVCRTLYLASIVNPAISVMANNYDHRLPFLGFVQRGEGKDAFVERAWSSIFYFARLRPRLLFVIGSALRALQTTTVLQYVFDPTAGVGFGLNVLALLTSSRWPATFLLGWASSSGLWRLLGAKPPPKINVPIAVSIKR